MTEALRELEMASKAIQEASSIFLSIGSIGRFSISEHRMEEEPIATTGIFIRGDLNLDLSPLIIL